MAANRELPTLKQIGEGKLPTGGNRCLQITNLIRKEFSEKLAQVKKEANVRSEFIESFQLLIVDLPKSFVSQEDKEALSATIATVEASKTTQTAEVEIKKAFLVVLRILPLMDVLSTYENNIVLKQRAVTAFQKDADNKMQEINNKFAGLAINKRIEQENTRDLQDYERKIIACKQINSRLLQQLNEILASYNAGEQNKTEQIKALKKLIEEQTAYQNNDHFVFSPKIESAITTDLDNSISNLEDKKNVAPTSISVKSLDETMTILCVDVQHSVNQIQNKLFKEWLDAVIRALIALRNHDLLPMIDVATKQIEGTKSNIAECRRACLEFKATIEAYLTSPDQDRLRTRNQQRKQDFQRESDLHVGYLTYAKELLSIIENGLEYNQAPQDYLAENRIDELPAAPPIASPVPSPLMLRGSVEGGRGEREVETDSQPSDLTAIVEKTKVASPTTPAGRRRIRPGSSYIDMLGHMNMNRQTENNSVQQNPSVAEPANVPTAMSQVVGNKPIKIGESLRKTLLKVIEDDELRAKIENQEGITLESDLYKELAAKFQHMPAFGSAQADAEFDKYIALHFIRQQMDSYRLHLEKQEGYTTASLALLTEWTNLDIQARLTKLGNETAKEKSVKLIHKMVAASIIRETVAPLSTESNNENVAQPQNLASTAFPALDQLAQNETMKKVMNANRDKEGSGIFHTIASIFKAPFLGLVRLFTSATSRKAAKNIEAIMGAAQAPALRAGG
ncbi:MAG TPA: hypothetical protein VHZ76_05070 [Gammaproteobacteria bacterium]|jgi:hypothetical protein|nr:hypothetical protein [Gammaproteobacteria bacterium]